MPGDERPRRIPKLPAELQDYELADAKLKKLQKKQFEEKQKKSASATMVGDTEEKLENSTKKNLQTPRDDIRLYQGRRKILEATLDRYQKKSLKMMEKNGSRTVLKELSVRITETLPNITTLQNDIITCGVNVEDQLELEEWTQNLILTAEDVVDSIKENLEARIGEAPSTIGKVEAWSLSNMTVMKAQVRRRISAPAANIENGLASNIDTSASNIIIQPQKPVMTRNNEEKKGEMVEKTKVTKPCASLTSVKEESEDESVTDDSSESSSVDTAIKSEVAKMKVQQEKARYLQQKKIHEAASELKLQQLEDEVSQANLEQRLRNLCSTKKPKHLHKPDVKGALDFDKLSHDGDESSLGHESSYHPSRYTPENEKQKQHSKQDTRVERSDKHKSKKLSKSIFKSIAKPELREFLGNEADYIDWRQYWDAFIDDSDEAIKDKMMLLKQAVKKGKAAPLVKNLGYSEAQYRLALERLERKYGGKKRLLQRQLNVVLDFDPIHRHDYVTMESFITKLGDILATVEESEPAETGMSTIYAVAVQKLPEDLVVSYQIYLRDHDKEEGLRALVDWFDDRIALQLEAAAVRQKSTKKGNLSVQSSKLQVTPRSYHVDDDTSDEDTSTLASQATTSQVITPLERRRPKKNKKQGRATPVPPRAPPAAREPSVAAVKCLVCEGNHRLDSKNCSTWRSMDVSARWYFARSNRLCFRCLGSGHCGTSCALKGRCGIENCEKTHHIDLHSAAVAQKSDQTEEVETGAGIGEDDKRRPAKIALRTITVKLVGNNGKQILATAFIDNGSNTSYVREDVAMALGCKIQEGDLAINTLVGRHEDLRSGITDLTVESRDGGYSKRIRAKTLPDFCQRLQIVNWNYHKKTWNHLKRIKFHKVPGNPRIDILLGSDYPEFDSCIEEVRGESDEPIARLTPLGWTCVGPIEPHSMDVLTNVAFTGMAEESLETLVQNSYKLDSLGIKEVDPMSYHDKDAIRQAEETRTFTGERYSIGVPWIPGHPNLADNREQAEGRYLKLEKGLAKKPVIWQAYCERMGANIAKAYLRKLTKEESRTPGRFLGHFPVIRLGKITSWLRIVADPTLCWLGLTLNDAMYAGPKLQNNILAILVLFRKGKVAVTADIHEMFPQIILAEQDRKYHRILWRNQESGELETYEFVRLPFGDRASPFLAQYVVKKHAEEHQDEYPLAAEVCFKNMYVDDALASAPDVKTAIKMRHQITDLLKSAGFDIKKWCSNELEVLSDVPESDRAVGVDIEASDLPCSKTLGLAWDAKNDWFYFQLPEEMKVETKRQLLRRIATIFDPLGILTPFVVVVRIIMQELWIRGLDWDDKIPPDLKVTVDDWIEELKNIVQVKLPRFYYRESHDAPTDVSLHTFADASSEAFAAVTYVRYGKSDGQFSTSFVSSKVKVAPLTSTSIPRLELAAAHLALRLGVSMSKILDIPMEKHVFHVDSMDVLYWIYGQSRQNKPYVANRVAEIHEHTDRKNWVHVRSELNSADLPSRGCKLHDLMTSMWFTGPEFLRQSESEWPECKPVVDELSPAAQVEVKKVVVTNTALDGDIKFKVETSSSAEKKSTSASSSPKKNVTIVTQRLNPESYSSWNRLLGVTARVVRIAKNKVPKAFKSFPTSTSKTLTVAELSAAETFWLKAAQHDVFSSQLAQLRNGSVGSTDSLASLCPQVDAKGVMRVGGRLEKSDLPFETKHPVILPRKHPVTTLVVRNAHVDGNHVRGVNAIYADLRQKYWVVHGREAVKECNSECPACKLRRKKLATQKMAPLPIARLCIIQRCFASCGIDFAGPFVTKITRRVTAKRYLCLFTCCSTRAVHLEMAYAMDTPAFLNAFTRMVARRGKPESVVSDNGTNLTAGEKELRGLVEALDQEEICEKAARDGIDWTFNPPQGPHFGGVFESLIKSSKRAMYATLSQACITDEELLTAIVEVEGLLNSRPLTYCSSDPNDDEPLTPNHFLYGRVGDRLATAAVDSTDFGLRNRWRLVQDIVKTTWQRLMKEYLTAQQPRKKWTRDQPNLKAGDVVLMPSPSNDRGKWPLGRVVEAYESSDGRVRSVKVRSQNKEYIRPVTKLAPVELVASNTLEVEPETATEKIAVKQPSMEKTDGETLSHGGECSGDSSRSAKPPPAHPKMMRSAATRHQPVRNCTRVPRD